MKRKNSYIFSKKCRHIIPNNLWPPTSPVLLSGSSLGQAPRQSTDVSLLDPKVSKWVGKSITLERKIMYLRLANA